MNRRNILFGLAAIAGSNSAKAIEFTMGTTGVVTLPEAAPRPWQLGGNSASGFEPNGHHAYEILDANRMPIFVIQTEGPWAQSLANVQAVLDAINSRK